MINTSFASLEQGFRENASKLDTVEKAGGYSYLITSIFERDGTSAETINKAKALFEEAVKLNLWVPSEEGKEARSAVRLNELCQWYMNKALTQINHAQSRLSGDEALAE